MTLKALAVLAFVALTACSTAGKDYASDAAMSAPTAHYFAEQPRTITLFTVVSVRNGSGAHSAMLINASEQVMFDPAGSFSHPKVPERNDVLYGMNPRMVAFYIDYHARETYNVVKQTVVVSPQVAELIKQKVEAYGAVGQAHCADSISAILKDVPGFEAIKPTWFPNKLSDEFAQLPGVQRTFITDATADHSHGVTLIEPPKPNY
ncbi:MAG: hypothetical protein ACOH2M_03150 [Cypionkella sp.]